MDSVLIGDGIPDRTLFVRGKKGDPFGLTEYLRERYGDALLADALHIEVADAPNEVTTIKVTLVVRKERSDG